MKYIVKGKEIDAATASRIAKNLCARLGTPEGSSGALVGSTPSIWESESTWRFRINDGSALARLGFGPDRKLVTIKRREQSGSARFWLFVYA